MYFDSRAAAGQQLAEQLAQKYIDEPCTVVALNTGSVVVAMQIALRLGSPVALLLTEEILLPQEPTPIGGITQSGIFSYNPNYTESQIAEFVSEYHSVIEQAKLERLRHMHQELSREELISPALLTDRHVILVSDGLKGGFALDMALSYLKPIKHRKIVVATPFADVTAIDRIHILADGVACLNVVQNYISTDHYYDKQDSYSRKEAIDIVGEELREWYCRQPLDQLERVRRNPAHQVHHGRLQPSNRLAPA